MWPGRPLAVLLLLGAAGCGSGLYPVQGKVTLDDGTSVTGGIVVFESRGEQPITARGEIQPDGKYQLSTHKPGDGVPPGKYRVLITPPPQVDLEAPRVKPPYDERYTAFATSGLEFEVTAGPNDIPIKLTRAKKGK
jgi:hypothetical protein